jgi:uncharacterized protein (DUF736 family)
VLIKVLPPIILLILVCCVLSAYKSLDNINTGSIITKVEPRNISTNAIAATSGSNSAEIETGVLSPSNAFSSSKLEPGNICALTGSSSSKIEPGNLITTGKGTFPFPVTSCFLANSSLDIDRTGTLENSSPSDKISANDKPQHDKTELGGDKREKDNAEANKNLSEKTETSKDNDKASQPGYVSPKSLLFGDNDSNPVFDRNADKIRPEPLGLGPIPLEAGHDALDFLEKYFEQKTNATLTVSVELLVSLITAYRNGKDRLEQATLTLNHQNDQIRFLKHANKNFRRIIERAGMDTNAMWDHAKNKAQDRMDLSLRDPMFKKPEDLDVEQWLRNVLSQAGIIHPVDEFSLDTEDVEPTASEKVDDNQSQISGPRFTPPPGFSEEHRRKVEIIMSRAGPDFYKTSKGVYGPNGELMPVERPYSPIINPRPAIIEDPDRVGIVQRAYERPLSPPVFHLKSKKENMKWPEQRAAAEEGVWNANGYARYVPQSPCGVHNSSFTDI